MARDSRYVTNTSYPRAESLVISRFRCTTEERLPISSLNSPPRDWRDPQHLPLIVFLIGYAALLFYEGVTGRALAAVALALVFAVVMIAFGLSILRQLGDSLSVLGVTGVSLLLAGLAQGFAAFVAVPMLVSAVNLFFVVEAGLYFYQQFVR